MKKDLRTILLISASILSVTAAPALAQQAASEEVTDTNEIIVTAQKKSRKPSGCADCRVGIFAGQP